MGFVNCYKSKKERKDEIANQRGWMWLPKCASSGLIGVGHNNSLESTLILMMIINVGHIYFHLKQY